LAVLPKAELLRIIAAIFRITRRQSGLSYLPPVGIAADSQHESAPASLLGDSQVPVDVPLLCALALH
jgi:hypothetical protein